MLNTLLGLSWKLCMGMGIVAQAHLNLDILVNS